MDDQVRPEKGRSGFALTDRQEQFARLIRQGVSNAEACRRVGINRRTGTRSCRGHPARVRVWPRSSSSSRRLAQTSRST